MIARRTSGDTSEIEPPKTSEVLKRFALPVMSAALAEDEEEQAAFELLNSIRNLAKK